MLVLLVGVVALGETTSGEQIAGVVLVAVGVLLVRGLRRPARLEALAFALAIAVCIASYTLLDKRGIRYAAPITYLELSMVPATIGYTAVVLAVKGRERVRAELRRTGDPRRARLVRRLRARAGGARPRLGSTGRSSARDERRDRDRPRRATSSMSA